jgi:hypothetical protein
MVPGIEGAGISVGEHEARLPRKAMKQQLPSAHIGRPPIAHDGDAEVWEERARRHSVVGSRREVGLTAD